MMDGAYGRMVGGSARRPHGEHERQAGPALPLFAQVVAVRVGVPRGQEQRRVADHQHGLVRQVRQGVEIGCLRPSLGEVRLHLPDIATQQLQQADRPTAEERHALNGTVAGNGEVGEQHVVARVPGVLDRTDHGQVQLARREQIVELRRRAGDELGRERGDAPVDRPIDRVAVDVADAAESHSAPSTTPDDTGSLWPPRACARGRWAIAKVGPSGPSERAGRCPGTHSSNVRTVWYSESRSTGSFPAPRIRPTIWSYDSHMGVPAPASWYTRSNTTVPSRSSHPKLSATCEMNGVTMGQWVFTCGTLSSTRRPTAMFFRSSQPVVAVPVRPSASPSSLWSGW